MKAFAKLILTTLLFIIAFSFALAQTSISGQQDIAQLKKLAESNFDLSKEDAVILFEGRKYYWLDDGRRISFVHRIIWINSDYATESYGDHRIAYDSERCDFHVVTVRTWMDNQWWETSETGIVPTTPDALEHAYDYTNVQEMMLLHNGIELPCILEVAYYVEDKEPFRGGIDGVWTFAKAEPVVRSWFGYGVPSGIRPMVETSKGLAGPEIEKDDKYNLDVYWWKMEILDKTPINHIQDPTLESPYLIYSTWKDWQKLGSYIQANINQAAVYPEYLKTDVDSILADALTSIDSINAVTDYIEAKVRLIEYNNSFWAYYPRPATRIFETAYTHYLDRAILVKAILEYIGFTVNPILWGNYLIASRLDPTTLETIPIYSSDFHDSAFYEIPTTSIFAKFNFNISKGNSLGQYDPITNSYIVGDQYFNHTMVWSPASNTIPEPVSLKYPSRLSEIKLILEYKDKESKITGKGTIYSNGDRNFYSNAYGSGDKSKSYLNKTISRLIPKAKISNYNPLEFRDSFVSFSIECEIEKLEPDENGRNTIVIGKVTGGIFDQLPENLRITDQAHEQNILIDEPIIEKASIILKLDDINLICKPENKTITNECGTFELIVNEANKRLMISREIQLHKDRYTSKDWPQLRQLLLAYSHERNNTIMFKTKGDDSKEKESK